MFAFISFSCTLLTHPCTDARVTHSGVWESNANGDVSRDPNSTPCDGACSGADGLEGVALSLLVLRDSLIRLVPEVFSRTPLLELVPVEVEVAVSSEVCFFVPSPGVLKTWCGGGIPSPSWGVELTGRVWDGGWLEDWTEVSESRLLGCVGCD